MIKSRHMKELAFFFTTLFLVSAISYLVVNPVFAILVFTIAGSLFLFQYILFELVFGKFNNK